MSAAMPRSSKRAASHAGTWYENRGMRPVAVRVPQEPYECAEQEAAAESVLTRLLDRWLSVVPADPALRCRAVIAP